MAAACVRLDGGRAVSEPDDPLAGLPDDPFAPGEFEGEAWLSHVRDELAVALSVMGFRLTSDLMNEMRCRMVLEWTFARCHVLAAHGEHGFSPDSFDAGRWALEHALHELRLVLGVDRAEVPDEPDVSE